MQATLLRVPMPGKIQEGKGHTHDDLLVVQLRDGHDPDKATIEVAVETIAIAATEDGEIIQLSVPHKALLRTSGEAKFRYSIGDDRMRMAIAKLFGEDFAMDLIERANTPLGWETTVQAGPDCPVDEDIARQQQIVLWLDYKARNIKHVKLAEFTSCADWTIPQEEDEGTA